MRRIFLRTGNPHLEGSSKSFPDLISLSFKMADTKDPEKGHSNANSSTPRPIMISYSISNPEKEAPLSISSHTHSSHDSITFDPLSPLEQALTPDLATNAEHLSRPHLTYPTTRGSTSSRLPNFEVDFSPTDPSDPRNWPLWYRGLTIGLVSYSTWTVVLYSTSYTSSMPGMMKEFHVKSEPIATLGVTTYLLGLATGSLVLAPMSEIF
jgi:hypothetical protein